jgi:hypothetical protein
MPKATKQQRNIARSIANMIERQAKDPVSCTVDDWNDYGAFQIVVGHPEDGVNLISLTPAIKRATSPFDNVNLDQMYGGIVHPEKIGEHRRTGKAVHRKPYTMVHIRVTEPKDL